MTAAKTVQKAAGTRIKDAHRTVLEAVVRKLSAVGYEVLGTKFCRVPGLLSFFSDDAQKSDSAAPLGCVRVHFLRDGSVTVRVMGVRRGSSEFPSVGITWND